MPQEPQALPGSVFQPITKPPLPVSEALQAAIDATAEAYATNYTEWHKHKRLEFSEMAIDKEGNVLALIDKERFFTGSAITMKDSKASEWMADFKQLHLDFTKKHLHEQYQACNKTRTDEEVIEILNEKTEHYKAETKRLAQNNKILMAKHVHVLAERDTGDDLISAEKAKELDQQFGDLHEKEETKTGKSDMPLMDKVIQPKSNRLSMQDAVGQEATLLFAHGVKAVEVQDPAMPTMAQFRLQSLKR